MPIDSEAEDEDDVIYVHQAQRVQKPMGWPSIMWGWAKSLVMQW